MLHDVLTALGAWSAAGHRGALATVVQVHGSAPLPVGTLMAVRADGTVAGAVSGGCVEEQAIRVARAVAQGAPAERLRFSPSADPLTDTSLPCGGGIDVLVEPWGPSAEQAAFSAAVLAGRAATLHSEAAGDAGLVLHEASPRPRLVLVGAGLLADRVAALAADLGWGVLVIDPREEMAARAARVVAAEGGPRMSTRWPAEALAGEPPLGTADALIALSHHPALDDDALQTALSAPAATGFVGALGSRRTAADRTARLRARGVSASALQRLRAPVGLDLGGWTPSEVGVSIVGELLAARHGRDGGRLGTATGRIHTLGGPPDGPPPVATQGSLRAIGERA